MSPVLAAEKSEPIFATEFGYLVRYELPNFTRTGIVSVGSFQPTHFAGMYNKVLYLAAIGSDGSRVLVRVPTSTFVPKVVRKFNGMGDIRVNKFGFTANLN